MGVAMPTGRKGRPFRWLCLGAVVAPLAVAAPAYAQPPSHSIGLVLTSWRYDFYRTKDGKEECPNGFDHDDKAQVRADKDGEARLKAFGGYEARGPDGQSSHFYPWLVKDPIPFPELQTKKSVGLNLDGTPDGRATDTTCQHEKFVSPEGQPVDNQMARVISCSPSWRPDGFNREFLGGEFENSPTNRLVIEITGVDDERNDPDVEVTIAKGRDKLVSSAPGKFVPYLYQRIDDRYPRFISKTRGRIVDGVLTTDPIAVMDRSVRWVNHPGEDRLREARVSLKLTEDGAEGYVAGYEDLKIWWNMYGKGPQGMLGPFSYVGQYNAATRYADGYKDPATGQCRAISTTYRVTAVRALIPNGSAPPSASRVATSKAGASVASIGQ